MTDLVLQTKLVNCAVQVVVKTANKSVNAHQELPLRNVTYSIKPNPFHLKKGMIRMVVDLFDIQGHRVKISREEVPRGPIYLIFRFGEEF